MSAALGVLLLGLGIFFPGPVAAQTNSSARIHVVPDSTDAGPRFQVDRYLVSGNTLLTPDAIGGVMTNVPAAFGTNVSWPAIQAVLGDLQMAYRERGYVTVSVAPPAGQKLSSSNTTIKITVIEAPLAATNVTGNRWFSTANVLRALPSLHTNMMLNSQVFQRELDQANASRDRQIYPVIGPGPDPGTSALTLKVKDTLPLHGRVELNNQNTPGTPELRVNSSVQYDNLWQQDHQLGLQYSFSPEQWKANDLFNQTPFDDPLVANYSGYYRLPLGGLRSVEQQVENNPASFGYNEVTHKFNLPPAAGPELNFYASRSTSQTGVKNGASTNIVDNPPGLVIASQDSGDNLTLNEALGGRLSVPLREFAGVSSTISLGLDYKHYRAASFNTNNFYATSVYQDTSGNFITNTAATHSGQPPQYTSLYYLPLNIGFNGSIPDKLGVTFFNSTVNFNPFNILSGNGDFSRATYTTNTGARYVTVQAGADRLQNFYQEWKVKLHADGQWANQPLFSNEQYAMGGTGSVRGYQNGEAYGDTGWEVTIEPQTPQVSIGMAGDEGSEVPVWVRGSVFVDYGEIYALGNVPAGFSSSANFCGAGFGTTANIGNHFDARVSVAWPLITQGPTAAGNVHVYFSLGAQF